MVSKEYQAFEPVSISKERSSKIISISQDIICVFDDISDALEKYDFSNTLTNYEAHTYIDSLRVIEHLSSNSLRLDVNEE